MERKETNTAGKKLVAVVAVLLVCVISGLLGADIAADRVAAQLRADLAAEVEQYLQDSGATVLYRTVDSSAGIASSQAAMDVPLVSAAVAESVVEINTESLDYYRFFGSSGISLVAGSGSGVILSADGYLITCYHVVAGAANITVRMRSGQTYAATVVGVDESHDLAVLKINASQLTPVVLGDSSQLVVGAPVLAVGNPLGSLGGTVTDGIISGLERELTIEGGTYTLLQTNAAINSGNSGGGLFNAAGELVGMVNAKAESIGVEGWAFALPINDLLPAVEQIISTGEASISAVQLGVSTVDVERPTTVMGLSLTEPGVYIIHVFSGSNAEYAGLQAGDRLLSVDGVAVQQGADLQAAVADKQAGDQLHLVIERASQTLEVELTLYAQPPAAEQSSSKAGQAGALALASLARWV